MEGRVALLVCPLVRVLLRVVVGVTTVTMVLAACGAGGGGAGEPATSGVPASTGTSGTTGPERCVTELALDCEGEQVGRLQRLLRERVVPGLVIDEDFGPATEAALREFEELRCGDGCVVDGRIVVDGPEWSVLADLSPIPTTEPRELSP